MSSFATVYAFNKLTENKFRQALNNVQYLYLAEIFPFFEENANKLLFETLYCTNICKKLKWKDIKNFDAKTLDELQLNAKYMTNNLQLGQAIDLGTYINKPLLYKTELKELTSEIFKFHEKFCSQAQKTIQEAKKGLQMPVDAIIGIHGRFTDYKGHLSTMGLKLIGPKFYEKAINFFEEKYKNPLFLLVSDHPPKAIKAISKNGQNLPQNVKFVGTIKEVLDGKIEKYESTGYDLALLAACDHVVISHGTFGIWASFLSSLENTHIMAHNLMVEKDNIPNKNGRNSDRPQEVKAMKEAKFENYLFMDDQ